MEKAKQLLNWLSEIQKRPKDLDLRKQVAFWLGRNDATPTPVKWHRIPNWARTAWIRFRRSEYKRLKEAFAAWHGSFPSWKESISSWEDDVHLRASCGGTAYDVGNDIRFYLNCHSQEGYRAWDHVGVGEVVGIKNCLISEPYQTLERAYTACDKLASALHAVPVVSPVSWHNPKKDDEYVFCVRVALIPKDYI